MQGIIYFTIIQQKFKWFLHNFTKCIVCSKVLKSAPSSNS